MSHSSLLHNQFIHAENKDIDAFIPPFPIPKPPCDPRDQAGFLSVLTAALNHEQQQEWLPTEISHSFLHPWEVKILPVTYKHPVETILEVYVY